MTSPIVDSFAATESIARNFTHLFGILRASIVQQLFALWFGLSNYHDVALEQFLKDALPMVQAAQETSSTATTAYVQMQLEILGLQNTGSAPNFDQVTGAAIRNGVDPAVVYGRPFKEVWTALSRGENMDVAVRNGADRLRQLVETDIQLSHTHTAQKLFSNNKGVVGFRRVPTGTYTCALCLVASTQRYHSYDLMPIHPGCDCRVAPIVSNEKVGQVVDRNFLNQIHEAIQKQFGVSARDARKIDYRKIMTVHNHGEFGPTLAVAGQKFTTV